ncbi:hypothetical protein M405DRAFT_884728, partial [Rhizopogon salebrosus TDB-379]
MPDHRNVAIFWDYENCPPPLSSQAYAIVNGIRRIAHIFGSVTTFKAYLDLSEQPSRNSVVFRSDLQSSGVSVIDCPHNGRKDVVDKMILVDMLAFAIDHGSPATIVLIAGDRDYAYAMSTLRLRQYAVVLIVPSSSNTSQNLKSQASVVVDWNYAILRKRPDADTPPVWQPYRDLGEDIVERLAREIQDPNEDPAVTLISSHHTPTAPTHTSHISAVEPLEPSVFQRNTGASDAAQCTPKKAPSIFPGTPGHFSVRSGSSRARSANVQSSHTDSSDDIQPAWGRTAQKAAIPSTEISERFELGSATWRARSVTTQAVPDIDRDSVSSDDIQPAWRPTALEATIASTNTPGHSGVGSAMWRTRSVTQSTQAVPDIDRDSVAAYTENIALSDRYVAKECVSTANDIWDAIMSPLQRYQNIAEPGSPPIVNPRNYPSSPPPTATFNLGLTTTPLHSSSHSRTISGGTPLSFGSFGTPPQRTAPAVALLSPEPTGGRGEATTAPESMNTGFVSGITDGSIVPSNHAALMHALGLSDDEDDYSSDKNTSGSTSSPVLTEVDDPSLMDMVESYLDGGQPFFDDIVTPSTINTSPPITEASGTPSSQESSLAPSWHGLNVTMSNVGTGSLQATSVINDNTNHHFSGYQAIPVESVENKIRRITPSQFLPLIDQLLLARSKGNTRPGRFIVALALCQYDKDVYKRAGVTTFKDYSMLAQRASLIELGGREGDTWITLHPNLFKDKTNAPKSPTPSTVLRNRSSAPQGNVRTSTATISPSNSASQSTIPNTNTSHLPIVSNEPIPLHFYPLMTYLARVHRGGLMKPFCSSVGLALRPGVYATAGASSMEEYLALAVRAEVVECGGSNGYAWNSHTAFSIICNNSQVQLLVTSLFCEVHRGGPRPASSASKSTKVCTIYTSALCMIADPAS